MLMALLYSPNEQIIAAAPACDQVSLGDRFWFEVHAAKIELTDVFETAYVAVDNVELRQKLLMLGIDPSVNGVELTQRVEAAPLTDYGSKAA